MNSEYEIFSHLPTGSYQRDDITNGSDDRAGRNYELASGYRNAPLEMVCSTGNLSSNDNEL